MSPPLFIHYICSMSFENVIGQSDTQQSLVDMVQHNRLSHALLFLGNEGSGALPLAIAFAQYNVCEKISKKEKEISLFGDDEPQTTNHKPQTDSCGVCPSCIKAQQLIHPDIHFSY